MYLNLSEANGGKLIEKNKRICYNYQKNSLGLVGGWL